MLHRSAPPPGVGFGLGRLHHVFSGRERERILLSAVEAGLTHFDVAAAYGDGLCEAEAGRVLRSHRLRLTFATKFGIPCRSSGEANPWFYFAGKALRKAFSPSYGSEYGQRDFSIAAVMRGVEGSLRRLRTDYLDCLFFHEPRHAADQDAVCRTVEAMQRLREQGKIRSYGVSATSSYFLAGGRDATVGDIAQFELAEDSPILVRGLPSHMRSSAFGLVRFYKRDGSGQRLDYIDLLSRFFEAYPMTMPILASNRPDAILRMGRAVEALADRAEVSPKPHPRF